MDTDAVSGNDGGHQSVHTAIPVAASSPDLGYASSHKTHQFPKHDSVKLNAHNFPLWKQQLLLILEGYGLYEFVLGTIQVPPQSVLDSNVSTLQYSLYSQKKGQLTIQEYLAKIQGQCDTLLAAGNGISEQEHVSVILASLPVEYESIRIVASTMNVSLDHLTEMLIDCEARQQDIISDMSLQANIAHHTESNGSRGKQFDNNSRSSSTSSR
ncbi:hypothetical protein Golob_024650, partial [Gossypium lobatum]|nr:hypothetical protein [Gossypium lobatum]